MSGESIESVHSIPTLINQFIATVDSGDNVSETYAQELAQLIGSKQLSLLQFIQNLGPSLTSDSDLVRSKAVSCLSSTLNLLSSSALSKQDINVLVDFVLSKLDDKSCLKNVLTALNHLIQFKNFLASNNLEKILNKILTEYNPKKNLAKVRYESFEILKNLLESSTTLPYITSNIDQQDLFVQVFLFLASGEKDPRNLLSSFKLNSLINNEFTFDDTNELHKLHINELFDVCFCYFPISFSPPANDPYKITAADLKLKLRTTIASQSLFAKDSFANLIEKLTSTNPTVRNDVLQTLLLCVETYSTSTIEEHWLTLWNALKFEILHNDVSIFKPYSNEIIPKDIQIFDDNDDNKSLILTLEIIQKLSQRLQDTQLDILLETVTTELSDNLKSIKDKSKLATLILAALAADSIQSFNTIVEFFFSYNIWGKFINVDQRPREDEDDKNEDLVLNVAKQRDLVDNFGFIFISYQNLLEKLNQNSTSQYVDHFSSNNEFTKYKDHLLIFLGQLLMTSSNMEKTLKCKIIQQVIKLINLPEYLNENDVELILGYFNDILNESMKNNDNWAKDVVVAEITNGLVNIMDSSEQQIINLILPNLLNYLDAQTNNTSQFEKVLELVGNLCINYQILEVLSIRLLNKLNYINSQPQEELALKDKHALYEIIIGLFISLINKIQQTKQFLMNSWLKKFIPQFLRNLSNLEQPTQIVIELSGDLVGLIIKFVDVSKHQEIIQSFLGTFCGGTNELVNFEGNIIEHPHLYVAIVTKALASSEKSCQIENVEEVISKTIHLIYGLASEDYLKIQYLQFLALLNNKYSLANQAHQEFEIDFDQKKLTGTTIVSFEIMIWLVKSLIIRMDKVGISQLNKLISWLRNSENLHLKELISRSLTILFIDLKIFTNQTPSINAKKLISKVSYLNVKLLYKQQVFEIILPQLIESYNESQASKSGEIYLNSLSLVIEHLPKNVLVSHLEQILPLVLNGLTINNSNITRASLSTLAIIIEENPSIVSSYVSKLIPNLLQLSTKKVVVNKVLINTEDIRALSLLNLLQIFIKFEDTIKYKESTLRLLKPALDDKKRRVRKICCDLRQALYELK
jgi:DNA repair/transcription protein MET18/MMS19